MEQKSETKTSTPIHLTDVGMDVRIGEKSLKKAKIKATLQGIEISIPTVKNKRWYVIALTFGLFSFIAVGIFILKLSLILQGKLSDPTIDRWIVRWLSLYLIFQGLLILSKWDQNLYEEKIILSKKTLKIGNYLFGKSKLRRGQEHTYDITKISNLRLVPQEQRLHGKGTICFEYGDQTTGFCKNISVAEASVLLKHLSDIIAFRCHSTEFILFGSPQFKIYRSHVMLQNPDVSELTFPFVRLKRVIIHTETYAFYLVERFLTYAVNYIGQDYLKEHVEVVVYGAPEKLHPNLHNSFDNLCKRVQVYKEYD